MKAFNFLKKKGIKEFKCKNNWYRYYVKLNNDAGWQAFKRKKEGESGYNQTLVYEASQQELANQTFIQQIQVTDYCPFPVIEFYEDKIASVIEEQKLDCDINYIKELIKLECYGIILSQPFRIVPARGESLHLLSSDLISINAYIKDKGSCMCLKKCLEIDYKPIGLYHNSPLPSWLNCDIIDDVIYLWGTPTNKDRGRIQLRLNDLFGLTVMQFDLIISHKDDQENPIKKLTSERNIKLQMRMNNHPKAPPSIDQNSIKTKNNQNSIEDYMNIHSDNKLNALNSRQKGMSIYAQKSYMSKQTSSDNDLDRVEDQEIGSIEMIQPQEDIRQFKYVPSQQKQKRVLQQQQSHLKNNEQTQQNLNDEEGGLQLRLQENQSKIQNTSEQQK